MPDDKKLYDWLLILVDDAGKGVYMSGRATIEDMALDVPDGVSALPSSGLLRRKLPKFGREVMKKLAHWKESKP